MWLEIMQARAGEGGKAPRSKLTLAGLDGGLHIGNGGASTHLHEVGAVCKAQGGRRQGP